MGSIRQMSPQEPAVLVTGGTGFLGQPLVDYLVQQGECVRVLGRRDVARWRRHPSVEHVRGDIADPGIVRKALAGINRVYHLAAATGGDWPYYYKTTIEGTSRLLETLAAQGGGRLVFVSSNGNYDILGVPDGGIIDEDCALDPNPHGRAYYARAKILSERIAQSYLNHPLVKLTIVRPGVIYGPGMPNPLVGIAFSVLGGRLLMIAGSGRKPVDFIYIDDAVEGLARIMETDRTIGSIYNLVHPQQPTQNEFLKVYRKVTGDSRPAIRVPPGSLLWVVRWADHLMRAVGLRDRQLWYKASRLVRTVFYSCKRLEEDTGFVPRVNYEEGLWRVFEKRSRT